MAGPATSPEHLLRFDGATCRVVVGQDGCELAKGIVSCSKEDLDRVKGLHSEEVAKMLPGTRGEAIHRDYLVLMV